MTKLILTFNKQVIKEFPFREDSMTIGRHRDNDIVIDNLAVSSYHAKIDKVGPEYILTDLQSTNGTFVNEEKISVRKLSHGDNILIGKHSIIFVSAGKKDEPGLDAEKTMLLETARQKELLSKQEIHPLKPKGPGRIGAVNFVDGSGLGEIELTKKLTKIGKADTSEIKLSGIFLGGTAATISRRPSGYTISFTGGMTKLKVNGKVVKGSAELKEFDTIELGSYKFQFYLKDLEQTKSDSPQ
ncbi:MAG: FHA domain-containing protein [Deltaproteobacteria bacterium]|nr:FHA domain-containing protein [Deltaproteobacteria bacterium]MBW2136438.1 FHA domain-containing protein [Deltaproteobacteria bacterium]